MLSYPKKDDVEENDDVDETGVVEKPDPAVPDATEVFSSNPPVSSVELLPDAASVPEVSVVEPGVEAPLRTSLVTFEVVVLVGASRSIAWPEASRRIDPGAPVSMALAV